MEKQNQPADMPRQGYAREPQILRVIPIGRSTLWQKSKSGEFPKPVKLSKRITAWKCEEVWAWIEAQGKVAA